MSETPASNIKLRSLARKFVQIDHAVIEHYLSKIKPSSFALYCTLKKFADYHTGECYPKIDTISAMLAVERRTIERGLTELAECGLIEKRSGQPDGKPNEYLIFDVPATFLSQGCDIEVVGATTPMSQGNKEELEPLNQNQLTLSPPSSAGMNGKSKKTNGKESDSRFTPFKETLCKFWSHVNDSGDYYWMARDAGQLASFLKQNPELTREDLRQWLMDYRDSDNINLALKPYEFLSFLHRYKNGPLNQYGKPPKENRANF